MTAQVSCPPPPLALELAAGRPWEAVWRNALGGTTWRLQGPTGATFLKVGPLHPGFDPQSDAQRLAWAGQHLPAPRPISYGVREGWGWIETRALPGVMAFAPAGGPHPDLPGGRDEVIRALGAALRRWHDTMPVLGCPWDWSVSTRLARCSPATVQALGAPPDLPDADRVVCHGDACNPNFLLGPDLAASGYVDLGRLGVADRWADLAPACLSVGWNFPASTDLPPLLLEGYGIGRDIAPDPERLAWYQRLWNAPDAD